VVWRKKRSQVLTRAFTQMLTNIKLHHPLRAQRIRRKEFKPSRTTNLKRIERSSFGNAAANSTLALGAPGVIRLSSSPPLPTTLTTIRRRPTKSQSRLAPRRLRPRNIVLPFLRLPASAQAHGLHSLQPASRPSDSVDIGQCRIPGPLARLVDPALRLAATEAVGGFVGAGGGGEEV
jgi:hypothetical protein